MILRFISHHLGKTANISGCRSSIPSFSFSIVDRDSSQHCLRRTSAGGGCVSLRDVIRGRWRCGVTSGEITPVKYICTNLLITGVWFQYYINFKNCYKPSHHFLYNQYMYVPEVCIIYFNLLLIIYKKYKWSLVWFQ